MTRYSLLATLALVLVGAVTMVPGNATADRSPREGSVVMLRSDDFVHGTYVIDQPGRYVLGEDISFNPNSVSVLTDAIAAGTPPHGLGLTAPVDAYQAGNPLPPQFIAGGVEHFTPGGPTDARYDPAAFGVGFFAAIAITADDVVLDLAGHTIEQSAEHALLQRFFAVVELADQPFLPAQGPSDFGDGITPAHNVTIENGTVGRSSHHGIHGNGNRGVTIRNVDFVDYEVGAVALNGVQGLTVQHVTATNRKDVPVLGTFSSAQFIKPYLDHLLRVPVSATTLTVDGDVLDASTIQSELRAAINDTHSDLIGSPVMVDGRPHIDLEQHPDAYALFHNEHGVVDGNSYSFLVNQVGVAVNGFPFTPDSAHSARDIRFDDVHVVDQVASIREIPALAVGGGPATDPVGAVFQTRNRHPDTGALITITPDDRFVGNVVANAQALVAKAAANGEFDGSNLSDTRLSISAQVLDWVEGRSTFEDSGLDYLCNGDSMFHVNKGAIAFRMDGAQNVRLVRTSVTGLTNLGAGGSTICGDYRDGTSHPGATLHGYGGSTTRAYDFAGSNDVKVVRPLVRDINSVAGPATGFDLITDSSAVRLVLPQVEGLTAGAPPAGSPTPPANAFAYRVGPDVTAVVLVRPHARNLQGADAQGMLDDDSSDVQLIGRPSQG
jgi:hypothetical protein